MIKEKYTIRPISRAMAMRIVVEKHYLHRKCPCSVAFGLFEKEKLLGVIIYGTPSSAPLRSGICGKDECMNVIELTRLWVDDAVGKNGESFLIGNTIPFVNKEIIVSFAEVEMGHLGVVYQATNWIYTGLSAKRTNWTIEGVKGHAQTIGDKYKGQDIRAIFGDKFSLVDRPRKHRYIYFNCSKTRKKQLFKKLKYKIEAYPKQKTHEA